MTFRMLFALGLALLSANSFAHAQTTPPSNASRNSNNLASGWQANSHFIVHIDENQFPPGSPGEAAVQQGFKNDQAAYATTTYSYANTTTQPAMIDNTVWATTATSFPIDGQVGFNSWNYTYGSSSTVNTIHDATISILQSMVDNSPALTFIAAHEKSHDNFLVDCPNCDPTATIMSYQDSMAAPAIEGPTYNDIGASYGFAAPRSGDPGCGDGGDGPAPGCPNPNQL